MEDGSLLPSALRYMQKLREKEQNPNLPFQHFFQDNHHEESIGASNALLISVFCIDTMSDVNLNLNVNVHVNQLDADVSLNRKNLLRKLATVHNIINAKLIPLYNKRYKHHWFTGGEGISFGLHCQDEDIHGPSISPDPNQGRIPHLRAIVSYGVHPLDEFFAMAMMKCITVDLLKHHGIKVAVECWDLDDGQILLIEGANDLPSWVDGDVLDDGMGMGTGVGMMEKRVYFVDGVVRLVAPTSITDPKHCDRNDPFTCTGTGTISGAGKSSVSRSQALAALIEPENTVNIQSDDMDASPLEFNATIQKRLEPFCKVLNQTLEKNRIRSVLSEYLHTAAIVLPLHLAIMIRHRPDLVSVAILSFCRHVHKNQNDVKNGSGSSSSSSSLPTLVDEQKAAYQYEMKPFENLVFTSIILPKTLYAMLLTAAGQMQPPMKTPKHYKSMELNRIKRQCKNGGAAYAHFRHAVEAGMRLSLGFEWLANSNSNSNSNSKPFLPKEKDVNDDVEERTSSNSLHSSSTEERINIHCVRIDQEAGGDGDWIHGAWNRGPNETNAEDRIDSLLKCPIWNPEILQGGVSPIQHPGKAVSKHLIEASKFAQKKEAKSLDATKDFPIPRADEVDSDEWIDMDSMDHLEFKMKDLVGSGLANAQADDEKKMLAMDTIMGGLEKFVSGTSDINGVASESRDPSVQRAEEDDSHEVKFDEDVFFTIFHRVLKVENPKKLHVDDIVRSNSDGTRQHDSNGNDMSPDLSNYFSNADLNFDCSDMDEEDVSKVDPMMKVFMVRSFQPEAVLLFSLYDTYITVTAMLKNYQQL